MINDSLQEAFPWRYATHVACNWFHDDSRNLLTRMCEQMGQAIDIVVPGGDGVLHDVGWYSSRIWRTKCSGAAACLYQQTIRMPVVVAIKFYDQWSASESTRSAQGTHGSFCAATDAAQHFDRWVVLRDLFSEFDFRDRKSVV